MSESEKAKREYRQSITREEFERMKRGIMLRHLSKISGNRIGSETAFKIEEEIRRLRQQYVLSNSHRLNDKGLLGQS